MSAFKPLEYTISIFGIDVSALSFTGKVVIQFETTDTSQNINTIPLNIDSDYVKIIDVKLKSNFTKSETEIPIDKVSEPQDHISNVILKEKLLPNVKTNYLTILLRGRIKDASKTSSTSGFYKLSSVANKQAGTVLGADLSKNINIIPNISASDKVGVSLSLSIASDSEAQSNGTIISSKAIAFDGKKGAQHLSEKFASDQADLKEVQFAKVEMDLSSLFWTILSK